MSRRLGAMKHHQPHKIRKGMLYPAETIISMMGQFSSNANPRVWLDGDWVMLNSDRMKTFRKSLSCVCCGIRGQYFVKEKHRIDRPADEPFHLTLYGLHNGAEMELTSDHKTPASKGGSQRGRKNRQTLCNDCNQVKADRDITLGELRQKIMKRRRAQEISRQAKRKLKERMRNEKQT